MAKDKDKFVHLHVHSDYSLLDGAIKVADIVNRAADDRNPAVALTDHGSLGGIAQLESLARNAGIQPIPGLEAYHVPSLSTVRNKNDSEKSRYHLTLLAVSEQGYRNLMGLSSKAWVDNFYYKPLIDDQLLEEHSSGIVVGTGCIGSRFNQLLLTGKIDQARTLIGDWKDIFADRLFIEIMDHGIREQGILARYHKEFAQEFGLPLLATQDVHYPDPGDAEMHDCVLCMQTASTLSDEDRFKFSSNENWMRSAREMRALFPEEDWPGACDNTLLIAEMAQGVRYHGDGSAGEYLLPPFPHDSNKSEPELLREITYRGAVKFYGDDETQRIPGDVKSRIDFELGVIHDMGFDSYFLIVADMVQWAKAHDVLVGPGRGSAAGSIVSYCTGITTIDPLRYGLYFERFLNPGRRSMPDIDIDFEPSRREQVQRYLAERYGADRVAHIATYGVIKAKSGIKASARILARPVREGEALSSMWPGPLNQTETTLSEVLREDGPTDEKYRDHWNKGASLRRAMNNDENAREILEIARSAEGLIQNSGIHAAAVLLTPGPLSDYVPLRRAKDGGKGSLAVCEYDKDDVEGIGGLKIDLLGLSNLAIIKRAIELIRSDLGKNIDVDNLPLDDSKVFAMLSKGETEGVFQLEGPGMTDLVKRIKPTRFEDISACIALYRPGPMGSNLHLMYADVKNGLRQPEVPHPDMLRLFSDTYGIVTYQEQLIAMAQHYAGYDAAHADSFRKAVGKKDAVLLAKQEAEFKSGVIAKGFGEDLADTLWNMIPPFAAYAFNKSHSISYAMIGYVTAWLKVNYPAQFVAACIDYFPKDRIPYQVDSARSRGVKVYAPNINLSGVQATTKRDSVWLGMGGISHCGYSTLASIVDERAANGQYTSLADFCARTRTNKRAIEHLIMAGCFDTIHSSRKAMVEALDEISNAAKLMAATEIDEDGLALFDDIETDGDVIEQFDLDGPDWSLGVRLARELETLGFSASVHPYSIVEGSIPRAQALGLIPPQAVSADLENLKLGETQVVFGTISDLKRSESRQGKKMSKFYLETGRGVRLETILFGTHLDVPSGSFVIARGMAKEDIGFGTDQDSDEVEVIFIAEEASTLNLDELANLSKQSVDKRVPSINSMISGDDTEPVLSSNNNGNQNITIKIESHLDLPHIGEIIKELPPGKTILTVTYKNKIIPIEPRYSIDDETIAMLRKFCTVEVV